MRRTPQSEHLTRPVYDPELSDKVATLVTLGWTIQDICDHLGVSAWIATAAWLDWRDTYYPAYNPHQHTLKPL